MLTFATFFFAFQLDREEDLAGMDRNQRQFEANSQFKQVKYYLYENDKRVLHFNADELTTPSRSENGDVSFVQPHGEIFSNESDEPVFFRADGGQYLRDAQEISLKSNVQLFYDKAEFEAIVLKFWPNKNYFAAWGNIRSTTLDPITSDKLEIRSNEVQGWPSKKESLYTGNVEGKITKKRLYQQGIEFSSDILKANLLESLITMNGNISLKKQRLTAKAGRAEIFLENYNKKLKYYALYDDIRVEEKLTLRDGNFLVRKAYSESLEGFQSLGKIVLSGAPRVIQGDDIIKGYQITLRENTELVEVDDANSVFSIKKED